MIGELVIGPNVPFWRAAALVVIAAVGALVYLGRTRANQSRTGVLAEEENT